jgi:hypothetical protein
VWTRAARELLVFGQDGVLYSVSVEATGELLWAGAPGRLFRAPTRYLSFSASRDGERIFFRIEPGSESRTFGVLVNWRSRLARSAK